MYKQLAYGYNLSIENQDKRTVCILTSLSKRIHAFSCEYKPDPANLFFHYECRDAWKFNWIDIYK